MRFNTYGSLIVVNKSKYNKFITLSTTNDIILQVHERCEITLLLPNDDLNDCGILTHC